MSPLKKGLGILFGLPILLSIVFFYYFLSTGEERIKAVCAQITPGMTSARLKDFSRENRLNAPGKESGVVFLAESRSFGRHACKIELDAGVVSSSDYSFTD